MAEDAPDRALWAEVLRIGIEDALSGVDPGWIGTRDFFIVAALAGMDGVAVRDRLKKGANARAFSPTKGRPKKDQHA